MLSHLRSICNVLGQIERVTCTPHCTESHHRTSRATQATQQTTNHMSDGLGTSTHSTKRISVPQCTLCYQGPSPIVQVQAYFPVSFPILLSPKCNTFGLPQVYDVREGRGLRYDLNVKTELGNPTTEVLHQGVNMWIINKFPWYRLARNCLLESAQRVVGRS